MEPIKANGHTVKVQDVAANPAAQVKPPNIAAKQSIKQSNSQQKTTVPGKNDISQIAGAVEDFVNSRNWAIKIKVDEGTDQTIVQIVSEESGKVIKQIPSEELLNLAEKLEEAAGALINREI